VRRWGRGGKQADFFLANETKKQLLVLGGGCVLIVDFERGS
jgi:hypothetical protein